MTAATKVADSPSFIYTEAATNRIDPDRVERMVKIEFSPLHELLAYADQLQVDQKRGILD